MADRAVGVVCVNFGSADLLEADFGPLVREARVTGVVVDNFSTLLERERIARLSEVWDWELVASDNGGFGAGVNQGVLRALQLGCDTLVVINPDAQIPAQALDALINRVRDAAEPTLAAPTVYRPDGSVWFAGADLYVADGRIRSRARQLADRERRPWVSGALFALTADTWQMVGGFDEDYFMYWEDVDFSWRLLESGGRLEVLEDIAAVHAEGGTQGVGQDKSGGAKSSLYYRYNIRNRLLFAAKHLDSEGWNAWLRQTPRVSWEILLQGGRRQFLRFGAPLVPLVHGIVEGVWTGWRLRQASSSAAGPAASSGGSSSAARRPRSRCT